MGNEYQYGAGGHQASGANEIFAEDQGDKPWWRTNFFISQPVLFGTWDGVFTSCLINIFGVIVFLRSGWIVAQAGVVNAVLIVFATGEYTKLFFRFRRLNDCIMLFLSFLLCAANFNHFLRLLITTV